MRSFAPVLFFLMLAQTCAGQETPVLTGYLTRVGGPGDFDVNGNQILVSPTTIFQTLERSATGGQMLSMTRPMEAVKPFLGESAMVYGERTKTRTISASRVVLHPNEAHTVAGMGIIDAVLPLSSASISTDRMIRADGYRILITAKTKKVFEKPLGSAADIHVNVWAAYHGTQRPDGRWWRARSRLRRM